MKIINKKNETKKQMKKKRKEQMKKEMKKEMKNKTKKQMKKQMKKEIKKKTKKNRSGGVKRKREENENTCNFQNLIDLVGSPNLLEGFVYHLSGSDVIAYTDTKGQQPQDLAPCLIFKKGHWKGYKKNNKLITYDSYESGVQRKGTNNYCQSFAAYLFAKDGLNELQKGNLSYNVQVISRNWIDYFKEIDSIDPKFIANIINDIKREREESVNKEFIECNKSFTFDNIMSTLEKLMNDENYAQEFAISKQSDI